MAKSKTSKRAGHTIRKSKTKPETKEKRGNVLTRRWAELRSGWLDEETQTLGSDMSRKENLCFLMGSILCIAACYIFLALVSYLFTGGEDQKLLCESATGIEAQNWMGFYGAKLAKIMIDEWFGVPSLFIPVFLMLSGLRVMNVYKIKSIVCFIHCMVLMIWFSAFFSFALDSWSKSFISWGGSIGKAETEFVRQRLGYAGLMGILLITAVIYLAYASERTIVFLRRLIYPGRRNSGEADEELEDLNEEVPETTEEQEVFGIDQTEQENTEENADPFIDDPRKTATIIDFGEQPLGTQTALRPGEQEIPLEFENTEKELKVVVGENPEKAVIEEGEALEPYDPKLDLENYKYPTLDLLKKYDDEGSNVDMEEQQANKKQIIDVLRNFGVEISSIKATIGPTITLYEITPAPGVRISKIRNLEDDIALSLRAFGIRIIAPIPGKGTIGIEVPNAKPQMVSMESIINSRKFQETNYDLPMVLGKTITNEVFMVDLAKMPHLLVAGATGQGKSVGLNAIITSLLYKKHPAELKLVMVDPKKVEFSVYSPIVNHFLAQVEGNEDTEEPIITDVTKVIQTLKSLCVEMDTRYDLLKKAKARNVKEYNEKFRARHLNPENGHKFMPYIVVVIDEFGDLIMTAGKEIELPIARIAQLARAVGIHMIIATQRPTTNIITGTIKANFPARMAFRVGAMVDSRTILDRPGANQLIGKGDMLFLSGTEPVRVQCAFVDTPEVERIAHHIACQQSYNHPFPLPEVPMEGDGGETPDVDMTHLDPMFEDVARMVVTEQCGSTSMIQRKFSIGYNRAGRLMDQLEKAGIVGPAKGSKPREVLCMSEDDLQQRLSNL